MKKFIGCVALAGAVSTGMAMIASGPPSERNPADPTQVAELQNTSAAVFAPFLGEWEITARWDSGEELRARAVYEWGLNGKHMREHTYVQGPKGEYERYETMLSYHAGKKSLACYSFAYDGSISEQRVETADGKVFNFGVTAWDESDPANLRQKIEFTSRDTFVWTVELRNGTEWKRLIEGAWRRKAS
jgi:hypothetical protein